MELDSSGNDWANIPLGTDFMGGADGGNNWNSGALYGIQDWGGNNWQDLIGYDGPTSFDTSGQLGIEGGSFGTDPKFLEFLQNNGFSAQQREVGKDRYEYSLFDKNNGKIGESAFAQLDSAGDLAGIMSVLTPAITGGVQGMNPGSAFFDNPLTQRIFNNALSSAGVSVAQGGNPITGAVTGGVNAAIPGVNVGGQLGIENPGLQNIVNRGLQGASSAAINGGDIFQGAVQAAAPTALGTAFQSLSGGGNTNMNFDYGQSAPGYLDQMMGRTSVPYQPLADMGVAGFEPSAVPEATIPGFNYEATSVPNQQIAAAQAGVSQPAARAPGWAQGLGGLMGMYSAYDNQRRARDMMKNLGGLFGANSPYAKQLRQKLERQDAARGRRSDYAGRETQLAAALADRQAATMPTMANLQTMQNMGLNQMFNNALKLGTNTDVTDWLGGLFKG